MGVARYELWVGRERREIDEPTFERVLAEHGLELSREGEPRPPALVMTVTTAGIEVAYTEDVQWAALPDGVDETP